MRSTEKILPIFLKNYIKAKFSKSDVKAILTNPEYKFTTFSHHSATAYWLNTEQKVDELISQYVDGLKRYCNELLGTWKTSYKGKRS